jgi:hypothetical protein
LQSRNGPTARHGIIEPFSVINSTLMEVIVGKVGVTLIGLGVVAAGVLFMRFGDSVTTALNRDYARMPFKFQYPPWWHRLTGALFVVIGLLVAVMGVMGHPPR